MLTTTNAGALLPGVSQEQNTMQTKSVKVVRSFYYKSNPVKVGEVIELPITFALEMIAAKKAEAADAATPKQAPESDKVKGGKNVS